MSREIYPYLDISSSDEIFRRVKENTPLKDQTEIGKFVGKGQGTISRRINADDWDISWAYLIGHRYGIRPEWLLTGNGPKNEKEEYKYEIFGSIESWLDGRKREWGEGQNEYLKNLLIEHSPDFRAFIKREEEEKGQGNIRAV